MRQLSDKEMELVALISNECTTPGDVTARLKRPICWSAGKDAGSRNG
jgi:hypothetical protein